MKAIGYKKYSNTSLTNSFVDIDIETPALMSHDLLVEVKGISINPVDLKVCSKIADDNEPKVIGYDAAGIVKKLVIKYLYLILVMKCFMLAILPAMVAMPNCKLLMKE